MDRFDADVVLRALWFAGAVCSVVQTVDKSAGGQSTHIHICVLQTHR